MMRLLTVMVTRPIPQGQMLCDELEKLGYLPIFFPTIDIKSLSDSPHVSHTLNQLNQFDWLIFISPQAVQQVAEQIHSHWPVFPSHVKIAAIGGGTATALQAAHLPVHVYPKAQWNSEGLLELPDFQAITNQKIVLVRGEGGRTLLAEELSQRGAEITHMIVYQRRLPIVDVNPYLNLLKRKNIDIIITTSAEILQNLVILLGRYAGEYLFSVPLIVITEQMVNIAETLGFKTILLTKNANHDTIIKTLKDYS